MDGRRRTPDLLLLDVRLGPVLQLTGRKDRIECDAEQMNAGRNPEDQRPALRCLMAKTQESPINREQS